MSVKKTPSPNKAVFKATNDGATAKRRKLSGCVRFMEISIEPRKSLKHIDSNKFKAEIKRWAKAVVGYARQVSGRFGSSRRNDDSFSSHRST